jgi:hypothetical protein
VDFAFRDGHALEDCQRFLFDPRGKAAGQNQGLDFGVVAPVFLVLGVVVGVRVLVRVLMAGVATVQVGMDLPGDFVDMFDAVVVPVAVRMLVGRFVPMLVTVFVRVTGFMGLVVGVVEVDIELYACDLAALGALGVQVVAAQRDPPPNPAWRP